MFILTLLIPFGKMIKIMKNSIILLLSLLFFFPLSALDLNTNLSSSEINEMADDLQYIIKKSTTQRFFIPNQYKKIISENISLNGTDFTYYLETMTLSNFFEEEELTPFYSDVKMEGSISRLFKESDNSYIIEISGSANLSKEYHDYYGPNNTKSVRNYTKDINFTINLNRNHLREIEDDSSFYFVGTTRQFTRDELKDLTLDELGYLRNEFFARRGFSFQTDKMQTYFSGKSWYKPLTRNVQLTEIETANVYLIRGMEQELAFGSNSDEINQLNEIYETSQHRLLSKDDIANLSSHKLPYLRNTFYAKKGLYFYSLRYRDYFEAQDWYVGNKENVEDLLSENDKKNIEFIKLNEVNQ